MCPGFHSRTQHHMWIEFVVGSRPCSKGFSSGSPVFLTPQKPTFLNSNSIGNSRATGLSVEDCCVSPSLNKVDLFIYLFICLFIYSVSFYWIRRIVLCINSIHFGFIAFHFIIIIITFIYTAQIQLYSFQMCLTINIHCLQ